MNTQTKKVICLALSVVTSACSKLPDTRVATFQHRVSQADFSIDRTDREFHRSSKPFIKKATTVHAFTGIQNQRLKGTSLASSPNITNDLHGEQIDGELKTKSSVKSKSKSKNYFISEGSAGNISLKNELPQSYKVIAKAVLTNGLFADKHQLEANAHNLESHKQSLLPQLRPVASLDEDGNTVASVNLDQVLFDGGRYLAAKNILLSEKDNITANLNIEENNKISNAISAYIRFHRAQEAQVFTSKVISLHNQFEKQAKSRVSNGIGDISELDLFSVKKLEGEAELSNFISEASAAKKELYALAKIEIPKKKPERIRLDTNLENAPRLKLAAAEKLRASKQLDFDKVDRLPRISLNGDLGSVADGPDRDNKDFRVQVSMNQPLNWGFNHELAASNSELLATELRYEDTRRQILDQIEILQLEISKAEVRIKQLERVNKFSEKRLAGFNEQFQAGKIGIEEASGIIETYKRSGMNLIDSKYMIYNQELEFASLIGVFIR